MWYRYQVKNTESGEKYKPAFETLSAALAYCGQSLCDLEVVDMRDEKITAAFVAGVLVGGTPEAIEGCYARGIEVADEGR